MSRYSLLKKLFLVPFLAGIVFGVGGTVLGATLLGSARFSDVPAGSYFDGPVGRLVDQGVIKGFSDGTFRPADFVTRADVAVMIDRAVNGEYVAESGGATSRSTRSSSSKSSTSGTATVEAAGKFQFTSDEFSIGVATSQATIVVLRTGGKTGTVSVKYAFGGGTAVVGTDFQESSGTLNFLDGETTKTIKVTILKPGNPPAKTLEVTLSDPTGGAALGSIPKATLSLLATGTAADESSSSISSVAGAGAFGFSADTYAVGEQASTITITVVRTGGSTGAVGVNYATSNGTATSGTQYGATQGTLAFAAGETSKTFTVSITDNSAIDGNKTVNLTLSSPTGGAGIHSTKSVLTIVDNETGITASSGSLLFSQAIYNTTESAGSVKVTVLRQLGYTGTVGVDYATTDGQAVAGADYTNTSGRLTFAPGETSKSFTVPILTDTNIESEESINLTLSNISGPAVFGDRQIAIVKIQ